MSADLNNQPRKGWVFLSGMPGAGKSTLAQPLSQALGCPSYDLDAEIERDAGMPVAEIFARHKLEGFREREERCLRAVISGRPAGVLALGGGTVVARVNRDLLHACGIVLQLCASPQSLAARTRLSGRPLLDQAGDPQRRIEELWQERAAAYADAHAVVDTGAQSQKQALAALLRAARNPPVLVRLRDRIYRIGIEPGCRKSLSDVSAPRPETPALVVSDSAVAPLWLEGTLASLRRAQWCADSHVIPSGETSKSVDELVRLWDRCLDLGLTRESLVVALGGGVVGDLAGFAASTLLRGIALAQVPTSLLAMVDSSVGGKTAINRPQGKNLIGTFYQPQRVLCDPEVLATLPDREFVSGLAEVVKSAWLAGEEDVDFLEKHSTALKKRDENAVTQAIRRSVQLKARIVEKDEKEHGSRALLNLGHTVGHCLEAWGKYRRFLHGEAVSLGMIAAFRVAESQGIASAEQAQRMRDLLQSLALPVDLDSALSAEALRFMGSDKKRSGGNVRWVLPSDPGETHLVPIGLRCAQDLLLAQSCGTPK